MVAQPADLGRDRGVVGGHRAGVAGGTEVLAGVEAGRADAAQAARAAPVQRGRPATGRRPRRAGCRARRRSRASRPTGASWPKRCTAATAWVRGVMAASTASGSIRSRSSSTSTGTGTAPMREAASAVAMKVLAGMITSPPGPHPGGAQRQLQRVGAVADADAVVDADELGVLLLEVGDGRPVHEGRRGEDGRDARLHLCGDLGVLRRQVDEGDWVVRCAHAWTPVRIGRAGTPTQVSPAGTSSRTTAPIPTVAPGPMCTPWRTEAFMPM